MTTAPFKFTDRHFGRRRWPTAFFPVAAVAASLEMMTTGGSVLAVMRGPTMCAQPVTR